MNAAHVDACKAAIAAWVADHWEVLSELNEALAPYAPKMTEEEIAQIQAWAKAALLERRRFFEISNNELGRLVAESKEQHADR